MFTSQSEWSHYMTEECIVKKKQDRKVYKTFTKYNDAFVQTMIENLIRKIDEVNLQAVLTVMANGANIIKRDNRRLMIQVALRGVNLLKKER